MTAGRESLFASRTEEDAEMWCDRCERRHGVVWFAPAEIWNAVMREGDRGKPDEFGFCCPTCLMQLATARGIATSFVVSADSTRARATTPTGSLLSTPEFIHDLCGVVTVQKLSSGYYHLRGEGPCNWAQPPTWPCSEDELEESFFGEAGEPFRRAVRDENYRLIVAAFNPDGSCQVDPEVNQ